MENSAYKKQELLTLR